MSRDAFIYKLKLLGWTYREIAEVVGLDHSTIIQVVKNFNTKLFNQEYVSGLTPEQIATNHNLTQALVWVILLEGKDEPGCLYL